MNSLLLTNVRPWGREPVDLVIVDGVIASIRPTGSASRQESSGVGERTGRGQGGREDAAAGKQVGGGHVGGDDGSGERGGGEQVAELGRVEGRGLLALPGFVNAHAHVDKSWWGQPWVSYGGEPTTQGRIAHERAERDKYGIPSVAGATAVLREFLRHGTTATRTHVDVDFGVGLRGIATVREAAEALGGAVEVEIVAFPQDGVLRRPGVLELLDRAAAEGATSIGGLDPASIDRDPVGQLDALFEIAVRRGVGVDIHLHDHGDLGAFQYELIAERTREAGLAGKVNVSHGFALGELSPARQTEMVDQLGDAGISWTTVAPVGSAPLPWREMRTAGVAIGLGTDGIRDLWSPYGDGDLLQVARGFARLHGLRTDEDLAYAVELATTAGARFVHRDNHALVPGARADVVLLDAENVPDVLVRAPRREVVIAGGQVVVHDGKLRV
jgi:cytosine deaminase